MKKQKKLTKNKGGRPTKLTDDTVKKLESIFKVGGTIEEATSYAGITRQSYYNYVENDDAFLTKMEAAQHFADVVAKNVVVDAIVKDKDISTARWWLEKRQFKEDKNTNVAVQVNTVIQEKKSKYGL